MIRRTEPSCSPMRACVMSQKNRTQRISRSRSGSARSRAQGLAVDDQVEVGFYGAEGVGERMTVGGMSGYGVQGSGGVCIQRALAQPYFGLGQVRSVCAATVNCGRSARGVVGGA